MAATVPREPVAGRRRRWGREKFHERAQSTSPAGRRARRRGRLWRAGAAPAPHQDPASHREPSTSFAAGRRACPGCALVPCRDVRCETAAGWSCSARPVPGRGDGPPRVIGGGEPVPTEVGDPLRGGRRGRCRTTAPLPRQLELLDEVEQLAGREARQPRVAARRRRRPVDAQHQLDAPRSWPDAGSAPAGSRRSRSVAAAVHGAGERDPSSCSRTSGRRPPRRSTVPGRRRSPPSNPNGANSAAAGTSTSNNAAPPPRPPPRGP